jgi:hypothetical protein
MPYVYDDIAVGDIVTLSKATLNDINSAVNTMSPEIQMATEVYSPESQFVVIQLVRTSRYPGKLCAIVKSSDDGHEYIAIASNCLFVEDEE